MSANSASLLSRRPDWLLALVLFIVAWVVFANTLQHGYAWDDSIAITENPRTLEGLSGVPEHFQFRSRYALADFNGYRPISLTSLSLDIELFGENPQAAHKMQVFYFSMLVVILFFTLRQLFPQSDPIYPFLATLLFAVHPLHVEVVANLKSRDELLGMLFGTLALNAFVRYVRKPQVLSGLLAFLFLILGILSKENTITVLGVFVVVAWLMGENKRQRLIGAGTVIGFVGLTLLVFLVLTGRRPGASPEETTPAFIENMVVGNSHAQPLGLLDRLANSGYLLLLYFRNFLTPTNLVYHSGFNHIPVIPVFSFGGILGLLCLVGLPLGMGWLAIRRRFSDLTFGFFFFFIQLALFLQVVLLVPDTLADRFMFAPSLGLCWMLVMGIRRLLKLELEENPLEKWKARSKKGKRLHPKLGRQLGIAGAGIGLLLGFWGVLTVQRNPVWQDNLSLFRADIEALEEDGKAHYYLATELMARHGNDPLRVAEQQEAVQHYYEAIRISPFLFYARLELGDYLVNNGRLAEGLQVLDGAITQFPDHEDPFFFHGKAALLAGQYPRAIQSFERAIELNETDINSQELLILACGRGGAYAKGLQLADEVLRDNPNNVSIMDAKSELLFEQGRALGDSLALQASFNEMLRVIDLQPSNDLFWKRLISRYQLLGDQANAEKYYFMALERGVLQAPN